MKDKQFEYKIRTEDNSIISYLYGATEIFNFTINKTDNNDNEYYYDRYSKLNSDDKKELKAEIEKLKNEYDTKCMKLIEVFRNVMYSEILKFDNELEQLMENHNI